MIRKNYTIQLEEDAVISRIGAAESAHQSLDYIPGSVWIGVLADKMNFDPQWALSGKIRFHNAYPLVVSGEASWPAPFSYHQIKGKNFTEKLINKLDRKSDEGQQLEQVRKGFVTSNGKFAKMKPRSQTKTSIDRDKYGSAKESILFEYESVPAGTRFLLTIDADDEMKEFIDKIHESLNGKKVLIGRSRSAEYGKVTVENVKKDYPVPTPNLRENNLFVYFASDAQIMKNGVPVLSPEPEDLGLPEAEIDEQRTYVRTRTYSPWNSEYNCRMTERQVICAGSVITLKMPEPFNEETLNSWQNKLSGGIGAFRVEGLGRVFLNPSFIAEAPGKLEEMQCYSDVRLNEKEKVAKPSTTLAKYLTKKYDRDFIDSEALKTGRTWAADFQGLTKILDKDKSSPSSSQWSQIRGFASTNEDIDKLKAELAVFCTGQGAGHGSIRHKVWNKEVRYKNRDITIYNLMKSKLESLPDKQLAVRSLYHAANTMMRSGKERK